jgi:phosphoglycerol geranylgeranyltransferase
MRRRRPSLDESVELYIKRRIKEKGAIQMTLIDPQKTGIDKSVQIAVEAEKGGTSAIMVGGSTLTSNNDLDRAIQEMKAHVKVPMAIQGMKAHVKVPIILFPNNISGVSRYADAIWFMSLLNSASTYYIIGGRRECGGVRGPGPRDTIQPPGASPRLQPGCRDPGNAFRLLGGGVWG